MKKRIIEAVHDGDLEVFLENLGILDSLKSGRFQCYHCGTKVSIENLLAVHTFENEIKFTCSNLECFNFMNEEIATCSEGVKNGNAN